MWLDGRRCRCASVSLASDLYRVSGGEERSARDPTNLSPRNIPQWDTRLCELAWASRLRHRLTELTRRASGLGPLPFLRGGVEWGG